MFSPKEIASNYITAAKAKTDNVWYKLLILGILAGVYISLAGAASTFASLGLKGATAGLVKSAIFPVGLMLVVLCGAELFTGNCLLIAPALSRKISLRGMLKNLGIVYLGNFIGSVAVSSLVAAAVYNNPAAVASIVGAAAAKCNAPFAVTFAKGILCNILVCLAVWAAMAAKSGGGKALAVYLPVFAFVICGFEHSIANMYYDVSGLIVSAAYGLAAPGLNFGNALLYSLIPSTLGNILGGGLLAVAFWTVFFERTKADE